MSLFDLPVEMLDSICRFLSLEDLISLDQACTGLNTVQFSDRSWYSGLTRSHPRLAQQSCRAELLRVQKRFGGWRDAARARTGAARELAEALDKMADHCHSMAGLPDVAMERFRALVPRHGPLFLRDALLDIIHQKHSQPHDHLARRHYALQIYREVQRDSILLPLFRRFMQLPAHLATSNEACYLLAQWLGPEQPPAQTHSTFRYYHQLASLVLTKVRKHHPDHPISSWEEPRHQPFPDSSAAAWTDQQTLALLDTLNGVLFGQLRLGEPESPGDPQDAALHRQLLPLHRSMSIPNPDVSVVMASLYVAVAGMLGVSLHSQALSSVVVVLWYSSAGRKCQVVDVSNSGCRHSMEEVRQQLNLRPHQLNFAPHNKLLQSLIQQTLETVEPSALLGPADISALKVLSVLAAADCQPSLHATMELASFRMESRPMHLHRCVKDLINNSAEETSSDQLYQLSDYVDYLEDLHLRQTRAVQRRASQAQERSNCRPRPQYRFCVGDIVLQPGGQSAVVCDRDPYEKATPGPSLRWARAQANQPWYRLLVNDCQDGYQAEDQLKLADNPGLITHPELGRYFVRYSRGHYVPVPSLEHGGRDHLFPRAQSRGVGLKQQEGCGDSQKSRACSRRPEAGTCYSGSELLPRPVPETWLGEWPEITPEVLWTGVI